MATYAALVSLLTTLNNVQIHPLSRITSTTHAAEDVIESHVIGQLLVESSDLIDLVTQIEDMNSLKETALEFQGSMVLKLDKPASFKPFTTTKKYFMVRFEEKVIQIMDRLTGHFDVRAWVTISQIYNVKNVLSELLSCLTERKLNNNIRAGDCEMNLESEDHELGLNVEAWDKIKFFFPDNGHRSLLLILALSSFEMEFLDEDQSWELFCRNVFPERGCPPELEEIGKNIVSESKGLPLSIVVIRGHLRNVRATHKYWESFTKDLYSILMSINDVHCLNILSLSYNHRPI
ncbi:hypothetical protein ACS0TY_015412 [Phlomoides rotata]